MAQAKTLAGNYETTETYEPAAGGNGSASFLPDDRREWPPDVRAMPAARAPWRVAAGPAASRRPGGAAAAQGAAPRIAHVILGNLMLLVLLAMLTAAEVWLFGWMMGR